MDPRIYYTSLSTCSLSRAQTHTASHLAALEHGCVSFALLLSDCIPSLLNL